MDGVKESINWKSSGEGDAGRKNSRKKGYQVGTNLNVNAVRADGGSEATGGQVGGLGKELLICSLRAKGRHW